MVKQIVGIIGRKGSGKSTLAHLLSDKYRIMPFAGAIKEGLMAMGIPWNMLHETALKERPNALLQNRSPRYVMQTLGTEWGRDMIGPDLWTSLWRKKVNESSAKFILVDDVRFPSEIEILLNMGATLVAIRRPPKQSFREKWYQFWLPKVHKSELLRPEDYGIPVIINDGSPAQMLEQFLVITNRGT